MNYSLLFLNTDFLLSFLGRCQKMSCNNPRAKNPRTGETHEYCSRQCMYEDKLENPEQPGL